MLKMILGWFRTTDPNLQDAKGGHNDLSRWKAFGGLLERPAAPAPIYRGGNFTPIAGRVAPEHYPPPAPRKK